MFINSILGHVAAQGKRLADYVTPPTAAASEFGGISFPAGTGGYHRRAWWAGRGGGEEIGQYAASTIKRKIRKGLPYDRVTLFDTGRLYASTEIALGRRSFVVFAQQPYAKYLVQRYGDRILWLGGQDLNDWQAALADHLRQTFVKLFTNR